MPPKLSLKFHPLNAFCAFTLMVGYGTFFRLDAFSFLLLAVFCLMIFPVFEDLNKTKRK